MYVYMYMANIRCLNCDAGDVHIHWHTDGTPECMSCGSTHFIKL